MRNDIPFGLLAQFLLMAAVGALFYHWAESLARRWNAWTADLYQKRARLKRLAFSGNAGSERNYRSILNSCRIGGALLVAAGVSLSFGIFFVLLLVRLRINFTGTFLYCAILGQFLILFVALLLVARRGRPAIENTSNSR